MNFQVIASLSWLSACITLSWLRVLWMDQIAATVPAAVLRQVSAGSSMACTVAAIHAAPDQGMNG